MARLSSRWVLAIRSKVRARRDRIASSAPSSNQFSRRLTVSKLIFRHSAIGALRAEPLLLGADAPWSRSHLAGVDFNQMPVNQPTEPTSRKRLAGRICPAPKVLDLKERVRCRGREAWGRAVISIKLRP